jgi:hypothetical protein
MPCRDRNRPRIPSRHTTVLLVLLPAVLSHHLHAEVPLRLDGHPGTAAEWALAVAVRKAEKKLSDPSCSLVFADFQNFEGRPLQEVLEDLGQNGLAFFRGLAYVDGFGANSCRNREVLATTWLGSRTVIICSPQFVQRVHREPGLAAAILIHEELHSLGLGENPPSNKEITQRVIQRCGK